MPSVNRPSARISFDIVYHLSSHAGQKAWVTLSKAKGRNDPAE